MKQYCWIGFYVFCEMQDDYFFLHFFLGVGYACICINKRLCFYVVHELERLQQSDNSAFTVILFVWGLELLMLGLSELQSLFCIDIPNHITYCFITIISREQRQLCFT